MRPTLEPMLALPSPPFDSAQYSFEIKWDGVRALAAVEANHWRLWGRGLSDYTPRYPELEVVRGWPAGTLLDGEVVALRGGVADLAALLRRHALVDPWRISQAWRWCPVVYIVFDLLYHAGRCWLHEPLQQRRQLLAEGCAGLDVPQVVYSAGVVGAGQAFYEAVLAAGHEGVVAKRLGSAYRPGRRAPAWRKIKPGPRRRRPG